jgi:transcriptional regulator with XRE-family HTH domain
MCSNYYPCQEVFMKTINVSGTTLLRGWITREDITRKEAASLLQTAVPTLDSWLQGVRRPSLAAARIIEEATGGLVKLDDWLTDEELASVRSARP